MAMWLLIIGTVLAIFLAEGTAVGQDILIGGAVDDLFGRSRPFFLEFIDSGMQGGVVYILT